jgi:site-specific recombinase XerD
MIAFENPFRRIQENIKGDMMSSPPVEIVSPTALTLHGARSGEPHNPLLVYLASLAPSSRGTVLRNLRQVAKIFGTSVEALNWAELRYPHVAAIREQLLARDLAPATVNLTLAGLRGVAREAWNLGYMTAEEYARIKSVKAARGSRLPAGRSASRGELGAVLDACAQDMSIAGIRDGAMIALLYAAGLRRAELAGLEVGDWLPDAAELRVKHGKGNKQRRVYLSAGAADLLGAWLVARGPYVGRMFIPINKGGKLQGRGMTAQAVYNVVVKRAQQAGIPALSPHDLRRTFVGDLLDAGADIVTVQQLAGHANVSTTARYDRRGEAAKQRAAGLLHVPYVPRRRTD